MGREAAERRPFVARAAVARSFGGNRSVGVRDTRAKTGRNDDPMASILILEPDDRIRARLVARVRHRGHRVAFAVNATELLCRAIGGEFDGVLADFAALGAAKSDVLRAVRRHRPHTAIVVTSKSLHVSEAVDARRCGADNYAPKSLSSQQIDALFGRRGVARVRRRDSSAPGAPAMHLRIAPDFVPPQRSLSN